MVLTFLISCGPRQDVGLDIVHSIPAKVKADCVLTSFRAAFRHQREAVKSDAKYYKTITGRLKH